MNVDHRRVRVPSGSSARFAGSVGSTRRRQPAARGRWTSATWGQRRWRAFQSDQDTLALGDRARFVVIGVWRPRPGCVRWCWSVHVGNGEVFLHCCQWRVIHISTRQGEGTNSSLALPVSGDPFPAEASKDLARCVDRVWSFPRSKLPPSSSTMSRNGLRDFGRSRPAGAGANENGSADCNGGETGPAGAPGSRARNGLLVPKDMVGDTLRSI